MNRVEDRRRNFKKGVDQDEARRRREDATSVLRKQAREENLQKRRNIVPVSTNTAGEGGQDGLATQQKEAFGATEMKQLVADVMHHNPDIQLRATQKFRKILSIETSPPIASVIETGVVPRFVQFLKDFTRPELQFEAAWALTNIASGTAQQTQVVTDAGAVPVFVQILTSPNDDVREQAVWALGNIAGDSTRCRDLVLESGGLPPLLNQLRESEKLTMLRNATWALSNLCRGKPPAPFDWVAPALGTLSRLVYSGDVEVLTDACWALSYLSDGKNEQIEAVIQCGVCKRLVELLLHSSPVVQTPALRTVGNIVTGNDVQTQVILQCGALPNLLTLLASPKKAIRKEACWTISNITAGNRDQINEVIQCGLIPALTNLLATAEFDIKKEAAWAISNATSGGVARQVEYIVQCGCIKPLCDIFDTNESKIITVALDALENILNVGKQKQRDQSLPENPYCTLVDSSGGISKIEALQDDACEEVYQKAVSLLEKFFVVTEVEDGNGAEAPEGGNFRFE
eukprot:Filipodium_phascolosomae@DN7792_c0_g1_i1.p1